MLLCSYALVPLPLRSTKDYVRNYNKNMQNEPNFRKSQMNVNEVLTMDYDKMDTWSIGKNEPKTNPIYPSVASGEAGTNPISKRPK